MGNNVKLNYSISNPRAMIRNRNSNVQVDRHVIQAKTRKVTIKASSEPSTHRAVIRGALIYTGTSIVAREAGENISALKCVRGDADGKVYVATNLNAPSIIGVTTTSATIGNLINIRTDGQMEDSSWAWEEDLPIFCGAFGALTQIPPTSGYSCPVGIPISPTAMIVSIKQAIKLVI